MFSVTVYKRIITIVIAVILTLSMGGTVFVAIKYNQDVNSLLDQNRDLMQSLSDRDAELLLLQEEFQKEKEQIEAQVEAERDPQSIGSPLEYQLKYPDFYAPEALSFVETEKVVYLTFDDGPSTVMNRVLNILKEHDVKATFFVVGDNFDAWKDQLQRVVNEGHAIGMHSATHRYKVVYESVDSCIDEFSRNFDAIVKATGVKPTVVRFPGGSINSYNHANYKEIIAELYRRGFTYYDWNVSAEDAAGAKTSDAVYNNIVNYVGGNKMPIVLLHCAGGNGITADALPSIIKTLKNKGYTFGVLDNSVMPVSFGYRPQ